MTTLMRWDPFRDLVSLQRDVDRLFGAFGAPAFLRPEEVATTAPIMPTWDVITRGEDLVVRAELPGVDPGAIDISVTGDLLRISGERRARTETSERDYLVRETSYGRFERSMRLPEGAVVDSITADYRDGVLEIVVPKAAPAEASTHRIEVHVPEHELPEGSHH